MVCLVSSVGGARYRGRLGLKFMETWPASQCRILELIVHIDEQ
jgi:hypothetical protein